MTEKLCMFCKHFEYERIGTGDIGSELTCGCDYGGFSCEKRIFDEKRPDDIGDFRKLILTAKTCEFYERPVSD